MHKASLSALALAATIASGGVASAASVTFAEFTDGLSTGQTGYTMNIDPDGDSYDVVDITITPLGGGSFTGSASPTTDPQMGSGEDTAFSVALLAAGILPLGVESTPSLFRGAYGTLGHNGISSAPRDFADIVLTPGTTGFTYEVHFADDGAMVDSVTGTVGSAAVIPLPAGLPLLLGGMAVLAPLARRKARA